MPRIGEVLEGRYRIESVLGEGGFGVVYAARQENLDREVAIKMLLPAALADRMAVARFQREVDMVRRLEHPNTVRIFDRGETQAGLQYYCMEMVKGRTLSEVISADGPLPPDRCRRIAEQVLMSLGEAHQHGIVHRDLKPGNIMLTEVFGRRDHVKVLDFGIGKVVGGGDPATGGFTTQGIIGTPFYMSPEQAKAVPDLDGRSDLYALGLILHEMLTSRRAIDGPSPLEVVMHHVRPEPVELDPAVAASALGEVIRRATEKDRDRRFPSAAAMLEALQEVPAAALSSAPLVGGWPPAQPSATPLQVGPARTPTRHPPSTTPLRPEAETLAGRVDGGAPKRGGALGVVVLLVVLAAVAGGVFLIVRGGDGDAGGGIVSVPDARTDVESGGGGTTGDEDVAPMAGLTDEQRRAQMREWVEVARQAAAEGNYGDAAANLLRARELAPEGADIGAWVRQLVDDMPNERAAVAVLRQLIQTAGPEDPHIDAYRAELAHLETRQARAGREAVAQVLSRSTGVIGNARRNALVMAERASGPANPPEPEPPEPPEPPEQPEQPEQPEVQPIVATIRGTPDEASVRVDGERVCRRLPCEIELPPGEGRVRARVSADGYRSESISLRRDEDRTYRVRLWARIE